MKSKYFVAVTAEWPGIANMGVDSYLGTGRISQFPIVRFYTWDRPTISYGCHQKPDKRINLALCRDDKIPVVARPTGGRELLHGHDLCYSVIWPFDEIISSVDAKKIFGEINNALIFGLNELGLVAEWNEFRNKPRALNGPCFAQIDSGEISIHGRKLIASAQRVFEKCIVQQGSIPLQAPPIDLIRYLQHSDKELIRRKLDEVSTNIMEQLSKDPGLPVIIKKLQMGFDNLFGTEGENGVNLFNEYLRNNIG